MSLALSNLGDRRLRGDVSFGVGLVSATAPPGTAPAFPAVKYRSVYRTTLRAGGLRRYTLRLGVPADFPPGEYRLVAWAECIGDTVEIDAFNNLSDGDAVVVQAPRVRS